MTSCIDVSLSLCIMLRKRVLRIYYLWRKYDGGGEGGVHTIIVKVVIPQPQIWHMYSLTVSCSWEFIVLICWK
jgi:hypothetical protein